MVRNSENTVTVKVFFKEDGKDIADILRKSLMLFIEKEVEKICKKKS